MEAASGTRSGGTDRRGLRQDEGQIRWCPADRQGDAVDRTDKRVVDDSADRPVGQDAPVLERDDAVARKRCEIEIVQHHDDADAPPRQPPGQREGLDLAVGSSRSR